MRVREIFLIAAGGLAFLAFVWYGVTGETGPIGWLNDMQQSTSGHYSRKLSVTLLMLGASLAVLAILWLVERLIRLTKALHPEKPPSLTAALPTPLTPGMPRASASPSASPSPPPSSTVMAALFETPLGIAADPEWRFGWRNSLGYVVISAVLIWGSVLGWYGWEWRGRLTDAAASYVPLVLQSEDSTTPPTEGTRLALNGQLLWAHGVENSKQAGSSKTVYIPLGSARWNPEEPVRFVARMTERQAYEFHRRSESGTFGGSSDPVLVRIVGAVPNVVSGVLTRSRVSVGASAALVTIVESSGGRPAGDAPTFDWDAAMPLGLVLSGLALFGLMFLTLAPPIGRWKRRRAERRIGE